jgi:vacuolar-type H+-ATPase subunit E/Vma4
MSDTLIQKIQQDAAREVAEIKAAGAVRVEAIARETDAAVTALKGSHQITLNKELAQSELVAVSKAKQASKIALQRAKRDEIDMIFAAVEKEIVMQPAAEYVAYFAKYAASLLPKTVAVLGVSAPTNRAAETQDILNILGLSGM